MIQNCDIMICDAVVRQYLPQVRAELVCRLVTRKGIPQAKVAMWMGLSKAAVSQYLSRKRGNTALEINRDLDDVIEDWADGVISGDGLVTICDICQCIRKDPISGDLQNQNGHRHGSA